MVFNTKFNMLINTGLHIWQQNATKCNNVFEGIARTLELASGQ